MTELVKNSKQDISGIAKIALTELEDLIQSFDKLMLSRDKLVALDSKDLDSRYLTEIQKLDLSALEVQKKLINLRKLPVKDYISHLYDRVSGINDICLKILDNDVRVDYRQLQSVISLCEDIVSFLILNITDQSDKVEIILNFYYHQDQIFIDIFCTSEINLQSSIIERTIENYVRLAKGVVEFIPEGAEAFNVIVKIPTGSKIIPLMLIESEGENLAIAQEDIVEIIRTGVEERSEIDIRGEIIPLINLRELLKLDANKNEKLSVHSLFGSKSDITKSRLVVVCLVNDEKFGIYVERLLGTEELYMHLPTAIMQLIGLYRGYAVVAAKNIVPVLSVVELSKFASLANSSSEIMVDDTTKPVSFQNDNITSMLDYLVEFEKQLQPAAKIENSPIAKIVLIDDSPLFRKLLSQALKDSNYLVHSFDSSNLALSFFENNADIDLIVADINMSDMDNFEFAKRCKMINAYIPIIALSSVSNQNKYDAEMETHFFAGFVSKIDHEEILNLVDECLNQQTVTI